MKGCERGGEASEVVALARVADVEVDGHPGRTAEHEGDAGIRRSHVGLSSGVLVHPDTAAGAGLADGSPARLVSPRGGLPVRLRLDPAARRDTAVVTKGGWLAHGRCLNVLVEPRFTPGTGTAFNQNFVRLEPG